MYRKFPIYVLAKSITSSLARSLTHTEHNMVTDRPLHLHLFTCYPFRELKAVHLVPPSCFYPYTIPCGSLYWQLKITQGVSGLRRNSKSDLPDQSSVLASFKGRRSMAQHGAERGKLFYSAWAHHLNLYPVVPFTGWLFVFSTGLLHIIQIAKPPLKWGGMVAGKYFL